MNNVTVVIPALNEPYLPSLKQKLVEYKIDVREEKGFSYAVWRGVQNAQSEIIVVMDADGSHCPETIRRMLKLLNQDIWLVVGSRYCHGGYSEDSVMRKVVSMFYCAIAKIFLRTEINDPMSCFWVGYKKAFNFKPTKSWRFGLQLIHNNRGRIQEYPIVFSKRREGKSHVKPLQAINDLLAIFKRTKGINE